MAQPTLNQIVPPSLQVLTEPGQAAGHPTTVCQEITSTEGETQRDPDFISDALSWSSCGAWDTGMSQGTGQALAGELSLMHRCRQKAQGGRARTARCWLSLAVTADRLQCQQHVKPQSPARRRGTAEGTRVTTGCRSGVKSPRLPLGMREKCKRSTCKWLDCIWESGVISTESGQVGARLGSRTGTGGAGIAAAAAQRALRA